MNWKSKLWRYATVLVVVLTILNPEMVKLALFIDSIGLEIFVMLIEIQVIAIFGALLNKTMNRHFDGHNVFYSKHFIVRTLEKLEGHMLLLPGQAALMHLLVISLAIGNAIGPA